MIEVAPSKSFQLSEYCEVKGIQHIYSGLLCKMSYKIAVSDEDIRVYVILYRYDKEGFLS